MTYRFRVIPVTRHGLPSSVNLKSNANYTFIGYVVDPLFGKLRSEIGSVVFDIVQVWSLVISLGIGNFSAVSSVKT